MMLPARTNTIKGREVAFDVDRRQAILALVIGGQCGPLLRASVTPEARLGPSNDCV